MFLCEKFPEKTQILFKKLEYRFLVESTKIENTIFPYKMFCQKPMLEQIEWGVQNGPITKNEVLPVINLFFRKFCFSLKTSYKGLIWCTNHPNVHIHTFWTRWILFEGASPYEYP